LAGVFAVPEATVQVALTALQQQGYAIAMEQGEAEPRWCERRLLARIHRYSREHRRQAVRPVSQAVYARFLVAWHQLDEPGDLDGALARLEGWAAPVDAWEHALLRARCQEQPPGALDQRFLSGQLAWFRPLNSSSDGTQVVSASPVALVPRAHVGDWRAGSVVAGGQADEQAPQVLDASAGRIYEVLGQRGAMFAADLERATGLLETQLEEGLKALVHQGLATADAFSPLRWLLRPEREKARARSAMRRGRAMAPVGRWSLVATPLSHAVEAGQPASPEADRQRRLSMICAALLRRYGVVFRAVLVRESLLPPWRDLLRCLRRMEDRGEVRGGRFVDGFSGEQFALPEALGLLRQSQVQPSRLSLVAISAADPLNLGGVIVPGPRTPAQAANRLLLEDGLPVARLVGGEVELLPGISAQAKQRAPDLLRVVTPWRRRRV
jgi:ATP-dependent Lhr-like helicase